MVRRAIFVIDEEGTIRHRKVAVVGLSFESVDDLERAVAAIA
jgi:peroxiredoxin